MPVGRAVNDFVGRALLAGVVIVAFAVAAPTVSSSQDFSSAKRSQARKVAHSGTRLGVAGASTMLSRYRRSRGLPAVRIDSRLTAVARRQARAMAAHDQLSHDVAGDFGTRLRNAGYLAAAAAENIAAGQRTLAEAFAGWVESPPHRANLLLDGATRIGIAAMPASKSRYRVYWALVVAAPAAAGRGRNSRSLRPVPAAPFVAIPAWR